MASSLRAQGLDPTDGAIMSILQQNGRESFTNIGKAVSLSATSVGDRLRRLELEGFIEGYHASVSASRLGYGLQAFVLARQSAADATFARHVAQRSEILECFRVTGEADFLMRVVVASMQDLERVLNHIEGTARSVQTLMVLSPAFQRFTHIPSTNTNKPESS